MDPQRTELEELQEMGQVNKFMFISESFTIELDRKLLENHSEKISFLTAVKSYPLFKKKLLSPDQMSVFLGLGSYLITPTKGLRKVYDEISGARICDSLSENQRTKC